MKKREKRVKFDQPCTRACRSRYGDLCLKNPGLSLLSDKVLYLPDPKNPDNGEYRDKNPITDLQPQELCPYSKPRREKRNNHPSDTAEIVAETFPVTGRIEEIADDHEFSDPIPKLTLRGLIKEGINHADGVMVVGIYLTGLTYALYRVLN